MPDVILHGAIVARSRNLRGMLCYAGKHGVSRAEITPLPKSEGSLRLIYSNGAQARANFACLEVLRQFVKARRSWRGAKIIDYAQQAVERKRT